MATTFHHVGVPTATVQSEENYLEGGKVYLTDPEKSPYRIEFLRFDDDSPMPDELKNMVHAAYIVDSIKEAMLGKKVIMEPFAATDTITVAFVMEGDALIELMEMK